jgi:hypothetical protein
MGQVLANIHRDDKVAGIMSSDITNRLYPG